MNPLRFMLIAGEPSGDLLAAELAQALRDRLRSKGQPAPEFFGAGGPRMAESGVALELDLTRYAIIGFADVLRNLWRLRQILRDMIALARERRPDVIVCVDYGGFNRRFAAALRAHPLPGWNPRLVQYVSPQVWASRPSRARTLARDLDLLVSILPMERAWYAARYPNFNVQFVGHPIIDRHPGALERQPPATEPPPHLLLLPGSRPAEIARHWPVMVAAARLVQSAVPAHWTAVFVDEPLRQAALAADPGTDLPLETRVGGLSEALSRSTLAIASTGTVTLECALWQVPTLALYKASWSTYQIARRIIKVRHLALPNLLAAEPVMPEFLQDAAEPERIARAATRLLQDPQERARVRSRLRDLIQLLGSPGAAHRAADAILALTLPGHPTGPPPS
ncbi:MAG: lipid-A-disaccharide synthase [Verrucomicrobiales bacterium]|nr:lipid-A-disaccharide synthase [Verrucomicrobiales bacterium]